MSKPQARVATIEAQVAASVPLARLVAMATLGTILAPLNSTMVAVALPEIRAEFGVGRAAVTWLVSAYLIAMAVAQPLGGRLGDQLGTLRVFRAGLLAFVVCSVACAVAPNFALLIAFRIAQAVAGAILIPNGMAMLRTHVPPDRLGRLNGITSSIISVAAAGGPLLGAGVLEVGSWRWMFLLSLPVCAAALLLARSLAGLARPPLGRAPIDWLGLGLFIAVLGGMTLELNQLENWTFEPELLLRWAVLLVLVVAFFQRQRRSATPAAEWRLFRSRSFSGATAYVLLTNLTMYTTLLMVPFFIRDVQGRSTLVSGVLLAAMSGVVAAAAPFGGRVSDAIGRRKPAQAGAIFMSVGAVGLLFGLREDVSLYYLAACLALTGLGLGVGTGPASTAAVESAPVSLAGSASGTSSMMRYVGSIVGAGVLGGLLGHGNAFQGDMSTFRLVGVTVAVTAVLSLFAAAFIAGHPPARALADDGEAPGR